MCNPDRNVLMGNPLFGFLTELSPLYLLLIKSIIVLILLLLLYQYKHKTKKVCSKYRTSHTLFIFISYLLHSFILHKNTYPTK